MKKILLTISYDGTNYCGWQAQDNAVTIQQKIEEALGLVFGLSAPVKIVGASRTDTGVHALDQKASFFIDEIKIPLERLPLVINAKLPSDIAVTEAVFADPSFHPRFHAKEKIYRYQILNQKFPSPVLRNYSWHIHYDLDIDKMKKAALLMTGTYNFSAFCASGASVKSFVRTLYEVTVEKNEDLITVFTRGNGFLYNMVRIIAGTLVYVGCGKVLPDDIPEIILSQDRTRAGITAPPQGLTLFKIFF